MNSREARYLNVVLTVIAVCLALIALEGLPLRAAAAKDPDPAPAPLRVQVVGPVELKTENKTRGGDAILPVAIIGSIWDRSYTPEIPVRIVNK